MVVLSADSIRVSWKPSQNSKNVSYEIHYSTEQVIQVIKFKTPKTKMMSKILLNRHHFDISDLKPNSDYKIWITAKNFDNSKISKSKTVKAKTFQAPNLIKVLKLAPRHLTLEWSAPDSDQIRNHQIILELSSIAHPNNSNRIRNSNSNQTKIPEDLQITQEKQTYTYEVSELNPGSEYLMKVLVVYKSGIEMIWPKDSRSKIITPSSKPLRPGQPYPLGKDCGLKNKIF